MRRIDEATLSHHFEVALAVAAPPLIEALADRHRRHDAIAGMARHLAERMRRFDIRGEEPRIGADDQPALFPEDLGPIGPVR